MSRFIYYYYDECHYAECHYAECHFAECCYAECHYAECRYAEYRYAECRYAECRGASCYASAVECLKANEDQKRSLVRFPVRERHSFKVNTGLAFSGKKS